MISRKIITGIETSPISTVMDSAEEAKYFSDLDEDYATAEVSFGQFLDGEVRAVLGG